MTGMAATLQQFPFRISIPTRWSDNDMFGHMNNVLYYRFYEAVILKFLADKANYLGFTEPVLVFAAESQCRFLKPIGYPGDIVAALGVEHLGRSSVKYALALFEAGADQAAATGYWVHVFVDRESQRPTAIPDDIRNVFKQHLVKSDG